MIVFIPHPRFINPISEHVKKEPIVLNLTSGYSGFNDISCLCTSMRTVNNSSIPQNVFIHSVEFDIRYANTILSIPQLYEAFMKMMIPNFRGELVLVLVDRDEYRDAIMESLIKFIQQRYGYNCWIVEDYEDIDFLKESSFSQNGILTMREDIKRIHELYSSGSVSQGLPYGVNLE